MKNSERAKRNDNVIPFPGVEKRLAEKGLDYLNRKKYNQAIDYLEEARELTPDNEEVLIGLVLAYFEVSAFQKARVLAKEMLLKGVGDYFQLVELYLTILIQLHEYQEIVTVIEALLEEKEIPPSKYQHFSTLLQFSRKMAENGEVELTDTYVEEKSPQSLNLLALKNINEQMLVISQLTEKNIRPYITEIEDYLKAEAGHPFLKSMLLMLLKEQEIDRDVAVQKFNLEEEVNPARLPEVSQQPRMLEIKSLLETHLESRNPVLYDNVISLVDRIFFISFPFELQPNESAAWAAAFQLLGHEYHGVSVGIAEIANEYEVKQEEIEEAARQIERIEKISYPNI